MLPQSAQNSDTINKGFLKKRTDYLKTYKGRFVKDALFVLYGIKNKRGVHRFGVTVPKTVGTAVVRNKFKRWCKELYRKVDLEEAKESLDLNIFFGNKKLNKEDYKNVQFKEFEKKFHVSLQSLLRTFR